MEEVRVTKNNGQRESYTSQKVLQSILRSGVKPDIAQKILARVEKKIYDKIPTQELYRVVSREIVREGLDDCHHLYRLREALASMDSIDFEKFISGFLAKEGLEAKWDVIISGLCSPHQADVLLEGKNGKKVFVEVKHHRNYHRDTGLGEVVELWGRLEDLRSGSREGKNPYDFTHAWLITNTKFSRHAKKYAACKKLRLTGWRYALRTDGLPDPEADLEALIKRMGNQKVIEVIKKVINEAS